MGFFCPITSLNLLDSKESFGKFIIIEQQQQKTQEHKDNVLLHIKTTEEYIYYIDIVFKQKRADTRESCSK